MFQIDKLKQNKNCMLQIQSSKQSTEYKMTQSPEQINCRKQQNKTEMGEGGCSLTKQL